MYKPIFNKRSVLKFTHFTNKGYSLFSCLGREVVIGVLSMATLSHATADGISTHVELVSADSVRTNREVMLEGVSVMGTRAPLTQSQQVRMVTVLTRDDVQAAAVQSINDLLKLAVGVDVRQRGPIGAQTDVSVRGSNYEQITVLLNGINVCDPQTGHNSFDFPVDISDIERIEVLEGPAARVYGTSSLVGAINVVTAPLLSPLQGGRCKEGKSVWNVDARAEGGSYGYLSVGGRVALSPCRGELKGGFHSLSASYTRSDGYSRNKAGALNADYRGRKLFYQGRYDNGQLHVHWHAGMSVKDFGSNTFYGVSSDNQFEHTFKTYTALQADAKCGRVHIKPAVYWNRFADRFEYFRGEPDRVKYNYHLTNVYGLNLNSYVDWVGGRTAVGAEIRFEDLMSSNLGEPLSRKHSIHGTDRDYEYGQNRTNIQFILEHNVVWNSLTVSAGLVAVNNSWADMGVRVYPSIDAGYRISNNWKVYASYNASLRMPSVTELYYSVGGYKADKYLKPEEVSAVETGIRYLGYSVMGKACVYYNRYKNLIDWIRHTDQGPDAPWESVNFGEINALGVEASVEMNLLHLFPSQHLLKRFHLAYSYIHQDKEEEAGVQSRYALEYLRNKLIAGLQLNLWKQLELGISYRLQNRTGSYTDVNGAVCPYGTYGIVDVRLQWQSPHVCVYLEANNLFSRKYVDYGNIPQPGLWVVSGIKVKW
ncbi:MAG: TonB-dependent receptor [Prevotella sp.]|nr:TonB-dependent receptor [Prevotella sp.]